MPHDLNRIVTGTFGRMGRVTHRSEPEELEA